MLEVFFYLMLLILLIALSVALHQAKSKWLPMLIGVGFWLSYVTLLANFGIFRSWSFPPRIPLLVIIPTFGFMFWFFKTGRHRSLLHAVPRWQPVVYQSFRIGVEFLILGAVLRGLGPKEPSFEGYNFDIITGITAPLIALLVYRWKILSEKWVFWWNIMGLLWLVNVIFIFISLGVAPQIWGYEQTPINPDFGQMPYLLIPALFMPCAVFMHVFSLLQLRENRLNH